MKQEELKSLNKILLAIDGSEISLSTTRTAIQLAKLLSAEILGLFVIDEELVLNGYADYNKELGTEELSLSRIEKKALFENKGHDVLQWMKSKCQESGVRVTAEIGLGGVREVILSQAQEASFLAIGRRGNGHSDSTDYLGRNFRYIAHRIKIPLLAGGDSARSLYKILLAYNGGEEAQRAKAWVQQLQNHGFFKISAVIVQEDDDSSADVWREEIESEFSRGRTKDFAVIMQRGNPPEEITKTAIASESDLVIIGGYRHKSFMEWLEGSTLDSVLRTIPLPVLVT